MFKEKGNHITNLNFYSTDGEGALHYTDNSSCHFYMSMCCCF